MQGHMGKHQCWPGGRKKPEKLRPEPLLRLPRASEGKARQDRVDSLRWVSLNSSSIGAVRLCLVPGLGDLGGAILVWWWGGWMRWGVWALDPRQM